MIVLPNKFFCDLGIDVIIFVTHQGILQTSTAERKLNAVIAYHLIGFL